jgi:hypothetical protein
VLEKLHKPNDEDTVAVIRAFAKNCECGILNAPDDANYVVIFSRYDLFYGSKLAEKKFIVMKVDGERLVTKGSVRRIKSLVSDSCKAILKDWSASTPGAAQDK